MNRTIKTAVLAGTSAFALASTSVQALDVDVYGLVDVWTGVSEGIGAEDSTFEVGAGGMSTSYLGFGTSQELSGDLTAVAALEMFFRPDSAEEGRFDGDTFFARSAFLGLQGDFGLVKVGRNTSPYFLPVILFNPFGDSYTFSPIIFNSYVGDVGGLPTGLIGDSGWSNSIVYTTPNLGGFSGTAAYAAGEEEGEAGENKMGANVFYRAGDFAATAAITSVDYGLGETDDDEDDTQRAALVGASYDFGVAKLFGQYQNIANDLEAGDVDVDTVQLGVRVPVGARGAVLASYARSDIDAGADDFEHDTWALGYDYKVSDELDLYAAYKSEDVEDLGDGYTAGAGGRFRF